MTATKNNKPPIIPAQSPSERDYMRNMLSALEITILCFEKETICFDNLASIHHQLILVRTDIINQMLTGGSLYEKIYEIVLSNREENKPVAILLDKLEKIDHLDQQSQSELLLLWEKDFNAHANVRFIATAEADLAQRVRNNLFRKDPCRSIYNAIGTDSIPDLMEIRSGFAHSFGSHQLESQKSGFSIAHQL